MSQHDLIQNGETLIIPNADPAVTVTAGHRRFIVGLDIAQSSGTVDANAFAIIMDEQVPKPDQTLGPERVNDFETVGF